MGEISELEFNVWKAKAISRGKLLERFRDLILNMTDTVGNEGDRVYFGSTNDFEDLRDIGREMEMWKWDRIIEERPERDPYADCRELRAAIASHRSALAERDAEIGKLREEMRAAMVLMESKDETIHQLSETRRRLWGALKPFRKVAGFLFERNYNASDIVLDMTLERKGKDVFLRAGDFFPVAAAISEEPTP